MDTSIMHYCKIDVSFLVRGIQMTLQQCYLEFGGNYEETLGRIRKDEIMEQLLDVFRNQNYIVNIREYLLNNDRKRALKYLQVLRGESQNLGLQLQQKPLDELGKFLTENASPEQIHMHLITIQKEYDKVVECLNRYFDSKA